MNSLVKEHTECDGKLASVAVTSRSKFYIQIVIDANFFKECEDAAENFRILLILSYFGELTTVIEVNQKIELDFTGISYEHQSLGNIFYWELIIFQLGQQNKL